MKKITTILTMTLAMCAGGFADDFRDKAQKIKAYYRAGLVAAKSGDAERAEKAFKAVLKIDARHGPARHQLSRLSQTVARVKLQQRKNYFTKTKLKNIEFNKATLAEALESLEEMTKEATTESFTPNFVIQDPKGEFENELVTLKMSNVPLAVALNYVLEGVGAKARYDKHATVIRPATAQEAKDTPDEKGTASKKKTSNRKN